MKITTMTEALSLVPEYWPLVPGVDKWREGDQPCIVERTHLIAGEWQYHSEWGRPLGAKNHLIGQELQPEYIGRRPIPQSVREAEARWILYNSMAKVEPLLHLDRWEFSLNYENRLILTFNESLTTPDASKPWTTQRELHSLKGFASEAAGWAFRGLVGGEEVVIQMLTEGPGSLWRWVAEMRE